MTSKEIHKLFEIHYDEFNRFERIPKRFRKHDRPDLCGILKLAELFPGETDILRRAVNHDELWFRVSVADNAITEEDIIYLQRCGIMWDSSYETFSMFI